MSLDKLKHCSIEKYSGFKPKISKKLVIKRKNYSVINGISITGDAPKEFICVYEYGNGRKSNKRNWELYIAKTGHKWYPIESITEHLLNRFGFALGINMSFSKLAFAGGQIRFLSKYFLHKEQELIHGAEIYAGFLIDKNFVESIEENQLARDFFTIQFTEQTIKDIFPLQAKNIMLEFVKMLLFDALVGNNDRHFYNWGVVRHIHCKHEPKFSPIYDTARGLFWNLAEKKIVSLFKNEKERNDYLKKYSENSKPKIGWEGVSNLNHYKLFQLIAKNEFCITKNQIKELLSQSQLEHLFYVLDTEFKELISKERTFVIKHCLQQRHKRLLELID